MLHCSKMVAMDTQTVFPGAQTAVAGRREPRRIPADDHTRVERIFLVTVGSLAVLEVGLLAVWLMA
jgi:hypothetical protein